MQLGTKWEGVRNIPEKGFDRKGFWLGVLPDTTCQRLAMHLSQGKQVTDVLSLALTSETQRQAVLSTLSNKVVINATQLYGDT